MSTTPDTSPAAQAERTRGVLTDTLPRLLTSVAGRQQAKRMIDELLEILVPKGPLEVSPLEVELLAASNVVETYITADQYLADYLDTATFELLS